MLTGQYDISDATQAQALVDQCITEFGRLDVVVNNVLFPVQPNPLKRSPLSSGNAKVFSLKRLKWWFGWDDREVCLFSFCR